MDWQALILQHLTGQDQMFGFLSDAPDAARPRLTPHRDKSERLLTDAQVLLKGLPPFVRAHILHHVQVFLFEEGLRGSVTAPVIPDVLLPFVLVQRRGGARANVAFDEGVVTVVPFGELAGSIIFSQRLITQQEADAKSEKSPENSHYPAVLESNKDCKEQTLHLTAFHNRLFSGLPNKSHGI